MREDHALDLGRVDALVGRVDARTSHVFGAPQEELRPGARRLQGAGECCRPFSHLEHGRVGVPGNAIEGMDVYQRRKSSSVSGMRPATRLASVSVSTRGLLARTVVFTELGPS